jgi:hypothetical protein
MEVKDVLGIVSTSLGVIQQIGNTPGVNLIPYVSTVSSVAGALSQLIAAEQEFEPLALKLAGTFKKDAAPPTEAEIAALDADTEAELAKLRAMPPREEGEPE